MNKLLLRCKNIINRLKMTNFEEIEHYLNKFEGGQVYFSKEFPIEGVAVIYLDNPTKKNSITGKMMVDFRKCVLELENWSEGKAVVIRSASRGFFCSGGDLAFAEATGSPKGAKFMSDWMQDALKRLQNLPLFSVALIEGPTIGGGAEIATFCDFILACENTKFGFVHGIMGIVTAWGGTTKLVQRIGRTKALDLVLTGEILSAKKCSDYGIVQKILPEQTFEEDVLRWLQKRTVHDFSITRRFKKIVNSELLLEKEQNLFIETWGSELNKLALQRKIKHIKQ